MQELSDVAFDAMSAWSAEDGDEASFDITSRCDGTLVFEYSYQSGTASLCIDVAEFVKLTHSPGEVIPLITRLREAAKLANPW